MFVNVFSKKNMNHSTHIFLMGIKIEFLFRFSFLSSISRCSFSVVFATTNYLLYNKYGADFSAPYAHLIIRQELLPALRFLSLHPKTSRNNVPFSQRMFRHHESYEQRTHVLLLHAPDFSLHHFAICHDNKSLVIYCIR